MVDLTRPQSPVLVGSARVPDAALLVGDAVLDCLPSARKLYVVDVNAPLPEAEPQAPEAEPKK